MAPGETHLKDFEEVVEDNKSLVPFVLCSVVDRGVKVVVYFVGGLVTFGKGNCSSSKIHSSNISIGPIQVRTWR